MAKVKNLWEYLMPFATDSTGVCSLFCDANAVVIGMDPGATAVRCYPFTEQRSDRQARYKGMRIGELEAVAGRLDESIDRLMDLIKDENAEMIVLVGTPVSSLISVDLRAMARRLEKRSGIDAMGISTTGNRYYDEGLDEAFRFIYETMIHQNPGIKKNFDPDRSRNESEGKRINLLGWNTLDFPEEALRSRIREHLEKIQIEIGSIWGMHSEKENWEHLFDADINVVCSASAYRLAERIQKETGMPYILLDELLQDTGGLSLMTEGMTFPKEADRILIVGEQVRSAALRKAVLECYRNLGEKEPEILHAGFFSMNRKRMLPNDLRLKSESDLTKLMEDMKFDLVIGDPMLRLLMNPSQVYLVQIHPPVSGNFADQFSS